MFFNLIRSTFQIPDPNLALNGMGASKGKKGISLLYAAILWVLLSVLTGCTAVPLMNARNAFYSNQPAEAISALSEDKKISKRDKLLFFMEKGMILHAIGKYEESTQVLLNASKLMARQDVVSVSRQTASLITTDWITEYKGEYSERLWVHTYLMMNFLLLNKRESALVEAKQALKILKKRPELSGDYFTRALIALCYENLGETNDAYIEYKRLAKQMRNPAPVAIPLYQLGMKLGFADEVEQYKRFIQDKEVDLLNDPDSAELVLFVGTGTGPLKIPDNIIIPPSIRFSFPKYRIRSSGATQVTVTDSARRMPAAVSVTTSLNAVAEASLQERAKRIIAKETARAAIKEAMSRAVEHKNEEVVAVLLRAALFLLEEPDTRCWQTLPASLTLLRVPVTAGTSDIKVAVGNGRDEITLPEITFSPGQRIYYSLRVNN